MAATKSARKTTLPKNAKAPAGGNDTAVAAPTINIAVGEPGPAAKPRGRKFAGAMKARRRNRNRGGRSKAPKRTRRAARITKAKGTLARATRKGAQIAGAAKAAIATSGKGAALLAVKSWAVGWGFGAIDRKLKSAAKLDNAIKRYVGVGYKAITGVGLALYVGNKAAYKRTTKADLELLNVARVATGVDGYETGITGGARVKALFDGTAAQIEAAVDMQIEQAFSGVPALPTQPTQPAPAPGVGGLLSTLLTNAAGTVARSAFRAMQDSDVFDGVPDEDHTPLEVIFS